MVLNFNTRHESAHILALQQGKGKSDVYPTLEYLTQILPTGRPPLIGQVSANFCELRVSRGQRNG
jgi:hypothetical protein